MVRDIEKCTSNLDSAPQKFINLAKIFKNVFNNCKNAGLCIYSFVLLSFGESENEKKMDCSNSLSSDPTDFDKAQAAFFPPVSERDYLPL
jgi:hypothetical protein